ncbi:TetR/AcrR family transcriptional regulator [Myceligenerans indicum]|uniref:TetR/AcrR family transcriptional regulator n=1 Tax=Myceligenerans indicum TaxID=2593663 RepID=A0ABS1LGC7_9MICO|nr:TetR/AcrR family transcriptional regulator C-terminal domain-containing protein [Myceligenerans indicum]MBL0885193.1 TetR/AcrR family transcriptional regulator [Myceligenerans indicum]
MVAHPTGRTRAGRKSSVDHDRLLQAATTIADDHGLDAVTFRALADRLGVSPMAVHRASGGIDALRHAMIAELVEDAVAGLEWPRDWQGVVSVFAHGLRDLLLRHPLVLEAHRQASLDAPGADDAAHHVVEALASAGLDPETAAYGYAAVHDFVTGHIAIRLGRGELELLAAPAARRDASVFIDHHDYDRRFEVGLRLLIAGIEATAG